MGHSGLGYNAMIYLGLAGPKALLPDSCISNALRIRMVKNNRTLLVFLLEHSCCHDYPFCRACRAAICVQLNGL